jgi:hypothetical protein
LQAQDGAAGVEGQSAGGVQLPVAKRFAFAEHQLALQAQALGPGDQVLGDQRELEPDRVERELAEGEVLDPALFGGADAILGVRVGEG